MPILRSGPGADPRLAVCDSTLSMDIGGIFSGPDAKRQRCNSGRRHPVRPPRAYRKPFVFLKIHGEPFVKLRCLDWRRSVLGASLAFRAGVAESIFRGRPVRVKKRRKTHKTRAISKSPNVESFSSRGCTMIIRRFLHWVRTASAGERAEATSALARAYLYSDLSPDDRDAAEDAMITLLDDPSPLVRRALAEALAASPDAPHAVIHALASDHCDIAAVVLARSPLLIDADLVDLVANRDGTLQAAIAARAPLQRAVA